MPLSPDQGFEIKLARNLVQVEKRSDQHRLPVPKAGVSPCSVVYSVIVSVEDGERSRGSVGEDGVESCDHFEAGAGTSRVLIEQIEKYGPQSLTNVGMLVTEANSCLQQRSGAGSKVSRLHDRARPQEIRVVTEKPPDATIVGKIPSREASPRSSGSSIKAVSGDSSIDLSPPPVPRYIDGLCLRPRLRLRQGPSLCWFCCCCCCCCCRSSS